MEVFMTQLHLFIVVLLILMNSIDGQYTVCVLQLIVAIYLLATIVAKVVLTALL